MKVYVPSPLYSYTGGKSMVEAAGGTVGEALWDLDRQYPGLRFRIIDEQDQIRQHIKIFVNEDQVHELSAPVGAAVVHIIAALSGGSPQ